MLNLHKLNAINCQTRLTSSTEYKRKLLDGSQSTPKKSSTLRKFLCLKYSGLEDDYYLNILDWSTKNLLAVGLDQTVYIWNAATGEGNYIFFRF